MRGVMAGKAAGGDADRRLFAADFDVERAGVHPSARPATFTVESDSMSKARTPAPSVSPRSVQPRSPCVNTRTPSKRVPNVSSAKTRDIPTLELA